MKFKNLSEYSDNSFIYNHLRYTDVEWPCVPPEAHDVFEIICLKKGDITYLVEGKTYHVTENSMILTRPDKRHIIYFNERSEYDRYDLMFDKSILLPEIYDALPQHLDVINLEGFPVVLNLFEKMDFYYAHYSGAALKNILVHLVEEIFYNVIVLCDDVYEKKTEHSYTANSAVLKAITYIEQNLNRHFTLDTLCKELYITKNKLHLLFLQHLQITPKKFIITKRLEAAQKALRHGMKPTDVYVECGFLEYSTFWRNYKRHFGCAPSNEPNRKTMREIKH